MGSRKNYVIVKRLTRKGFHAEMSGHIKLTFCYNGRDTAIRTWVSHGKKEIGDRLLSITAEQLALSRKQFDDLVDCRLDGEGLAALCQLPLPEGRGLHRESHGDYNDAI